MPEIRASVDIDASAARVWCILTNLDAHDEWNPLMSRVRADLRPGGKIDFIVGLDGRELPIAGRLLRVDPERELCWRAPRWPLVGHVFAGEHYFELERIDAQRTRLHHGERFEGAVARPLLSRLGPRLESVYHDVARALKDRAESHAG